MAGQRGADATERGAANQRRTLRVWSELRGDGNIASLMKIRGGSQRRRFAFFAEGAVAKGWHAGSPQRHGFYFTNAADAKHASVTIAAVDHKGEEPEI
jgi:hypothetical protein